MVEKMNTRLGFTIAAGADLTVDEVIQYALLNELLQETENNYRAADMRLKSALMGPALNLLWDPALQQQDAVKIYEVIRDLFVKHTPLEPWDLLKDIIIKEDKEIAKQKKEQQWAGVNQADGP